MPVKTIEIHGANEHNAISKTRVGCRGVVLKGSGMLISHEVNTDYYLIPGGGLEDGETLEECCIREVREETGYIVKPVRHFLTINEYYEDCKYTGHYFICEVTGEGEQSLTDSERERGLVPEWIDINTMLEKYSKHGDFAEVNEDKRGAYLREYTALKEYFEQTTDENKVYALTNDESLAVISQNNAVIKHYDLLIEENNDPVHDPKPLQDHMNKWDGQAFIDSMELNKDKSVLEIGVGCGRLAIRVAPMCGQFYGIDISPKTIARAKENLSEQANIVLLCGDFLSYQFDRSFDVIYSSLTFMHIEEKQRAVNKIAELLNDAGRFVLSIDKNPSDFIDTGTRKIKIYPDTPDAISGYIRTAGLNILKQYDTEFATVFVAWKSASIMESRKNEI